MHNQRNCSTFTLSRRWSIWSQHKLEKPWGFLNLHQILGLGQSEHHCGCATPSSWCSRSREMCWDSCAKVTLSWESGVQWAEWDWAAVAGLGDVSFSETLAESQSGWLTLLRSVLHSWNSSETSGLFQMYIAVQAEPTSLPLLVKDGSCLQWDLFSFHAKGVP